MEGRILCYLDSKMYPQTLLSLETLLLDIRIWDKQLLENARCLICFVLSNRFLANVCMCSTVKRDPKAPKPKFPTVSCLWSLASFCLIRRGCYLIGCATYWGRAPFVLEGPRV